MVLHGTGETVRSLAFCPSQGNLVCGAEGKIRVWDLQTGTQVVEYEGESPILCVASAPDGREIVYGTTSGTVMAWKYSEEPQPVCIGEHEGSVLCVKYSHKGDVIASLSEYKISLWESMGKEAVNAISGAGIGFKYLDFSPDDHSLATVQASRQIGIWNVTDGRMVRSFNGCGRDEWTATLASVVFSPGGRVLASCADDGKVRLWDPETGKQLACLTGHKDRVTCIGSTPDGDYLVSGGWDQSVRTWDIEKKRQLAHSHVGHPVNCLDISPDGQLIACGAHDTIEIWNPLENSEQLLCRDHEGPIWWVDFIPDQRQLLTGSDDGSLRLWDLGDGEEKRQISNIGGHIESLAIAPQGAVVAFGLSDSSVCLWDARNDKKPVRLEGSAAPMCRLAFALGDERLVGVSAANELLIWETSQGKIVARLSALAEPVRSFDISPTGDSVVAALAKGHISVLDARSGDVCWKLAARRHSVRTVRFSPNSNLVAIGSKDGGIDLRMAGDGKVTRSLGYDQQPIKDVALSEDGRWIGWTLERGGVRVADLTSKRAPVHKVDAGITVDEIVFTSDRDGSGLLVGWTHPIAWIWDVHTGRCVERFDGVNNLQVVNGGTRLARYVPRKMGLETSIYDRHTKTAVAWLDQSVQVALAHPSRALWVSAYDTRHVGIFSLEEGDSQSSSLLV
jgi:WD40 repeat protein